MAVGCILTRAGEYEMEIPIKQRALRSISEHSTLAKRADLDCGFQSGRSDHGGKVFLLQRALHPSMGGLPFLLSSATVFCQSYTLFSARRTRHSVICA